MPTPPAPVARRLRLDLWTDLGCPWCYLGQARLTQAIAQAGIDGDVELVLHSFELDPTASTEPITIPEIWVKKHGGTVDDAQRAQARVGGLIEAEGLPFTTDRLHANTFDIHRVLQLAKVHGVSDAYFTALQGAFFAGEVNPYDHRVLVEHAEKAGIPADEVRDVLGSQRFADEVRADEDRAREMGVNGVPFLVLDERFAVSGAQSVDVFAEAITAALADTP